MDTFIEYESRWQRLQEAEDNRRTFFEELINELKKTEDIKEQLEREKETSRLYFKRSRELESASSKTQKDIDKSAFILVLIDGESMPFLDDFAKNAEAGGQDASQRLKGTVREHLGQSFPDLSPETEIMVRIYADYQALSKLYCDTGILKESVEFQRFISGFNKSHAFCDFIDAGNGKECSENKIREVLKRNISDPHCKHIVLRGSTGSETARMLEPYARDSTITKRITLIEGPVMGPEIARLSKKFKVWWDGKVFRDTKILDRSSLASSLQSPSWANLPPSPGLGGQIGGYPSRDFTGKPGFSKSRLTEGGSYPRR